MMHVIARPIKIGSAGQALPWIVTLSYFKRLSAIPEMIIRTNTTTSKSSVVEEEVRKFKSMSEQWWEYSGECKGLHSMNKLRVPLIRDGILQTTSRTSSTVDDRKKSPNPLTGFKVLEVGCGGGILSEPLARLGAEVTGLDPVEEIIFAAQSHAEKSTFASVRGIRYLAESIESHAENHQGQYDGVVASEVVDHIVDVEGFVNKCVDVTKCGGSLFITTINKTFASWLLAIIMAEKVFRIVPEGIHDWNKFVPLQELEYILLNAGCQTQAVHGLSFNPVTNTWFWVQNTCVNYAIHAVKTSDKN